MLALEPRKGDDEGPPVVFLCVGAMKAFCLVCVRVTFVRAPRSTVVHKGASHAICDSDRSTGVGVFRRADSKQCGFVAPAASENESGRIPLATLTPVQVGESVAACLLANSPARSDIFSDTAAHFEEHRLSFSGGRCDRRRCLIHVFRAEHIPARSVSSGLAGQRCRSHRPAGGPPGHPSLTPRSTATAETTRAPADPRHRTDRVRPVSSASSSSRRRRCAPGGGARNRRCSRPGASRCGTSG